jgi:hypothetical protein
MVEDDFFAFFVIRLDSESALLVMSMLNQLARGGKTVVAVIHQPSYKIFRLIDHIMVLKNGGRIVVNGPGLGHSSHGVFINEAMTVSAEIDRANRLFVECLPRVWTEKRVSNGEFEFLEPGENIADWILEKVESEVAGDADIVGPYCAAEVQRRLEEVRQRAPGVPAKQLSSIVLQFWVFCRQSVLLLVRKPLTLAMSFILVCVAGVLLGVIFDSQHYVGPVGKKRLEMGCLFFLFHLFVVDATARLSCPDWLAEKCKLPQIDPIPTTASIGRTALKCFFFFG